MFYTLIWLIIWLMAGAPAFSFSSPVFWSFIVALLADIFIHGWPYFRRA